MKTLIIYIEEAPQFTIVDGDYSRFNGAMINAIPEFATGYEEEFQSFFYENDGSYKFHLTDDISLIEDKQWDKVALVTFLL